MDGSPKRGVLPSSNIRVEHWAGMPSFQWQHNRFLWSHLMFQTSLCNDSRNWICWHYKQGKWDNFNSVGRQEQDVNSSVLYSSYKWMLKEEFWIVQFSLKLGIIWIRFVDWKYWQGSPTEARLRCTTHGWIIVFCNC